ncbi:hypothetical protein F5X99DRAFT_391829 [Biscogniauxia marginata]|nr:hypothetical protein F5X99DRAFT_391829 [Biscogniauxia marginata]
MYLSALTIRPLTTSSFQCLTGLNGTAPWGLKYLPPEGTQLLTQSFPPNQTSSWVIGEGDCVNEYYFYAATNVTTSVTTKVYRPEIVWVTVLLICSLILIGIGILGIVCESRSLAPNRFDAVLRHTFDNPEFGAGIGGTTLDVDERLKLLGQIEVEVGVLGKDGMSDVSVLVSRGMSYRCSWEAI